jgi:hypothetical protein
MNKFYVTKEIAEKLVSKGIYLESDYVLERNIIARRYEDLHIPRIDEVLAWLREEKNIDVEIHAEAGMLGNKVYVPFISTYTEFTLETSPDVIRYRQKKFNPAKPLSHEIILALTYFNKWEEAALDAIEYIINNLI